MKAWIIWMWKAPYRAITRYHVGRMERAIIRWIQTGSDEDHREAKRMHDAFIRWTK